MALAPLLYNALGGAIPLRIEMYDGSGAGPLDAVATMRINSERGLSRFLSRPGELGIVRAYVSGDVDIEGDLFTMLEVGSTLDLSLRTVRLAPALALVRETVLGFLRSPPAPPE